MSEEIEQKLLITYSPETLSQGVESPNFENSKLKIIDLKSIAKLKIIALIGRNKSRDLFYFGVILERCVLDKNEEEIREKLSDKYYRFQKLMML